MDIIDTKNNSVFMPSEYYMKDMAYKKRLPSQASDKAYSKDDLMDCLKRFNYIENINATTLTVINPFKDTNKLNINSKDFRTAIFKILRDHHVSLYMTPGDTSFISLASERTLHFIMMIIFPFFNVFIY
jgi:hypothetical protein